MESMKLGVQIFDSDGKGLWFPDQPWQKELHNMQPHFSDILISQHPKTDLHYGGAQS